MVNQRMVRNEASNVAADARKTRDLSDRESECLRDLLADDEAFALLVTAQQNAVLVDQNDHDIGQTVEQTAIDAASAAGDSVDLIIEERIGDAKDVVAFADEVNALSWAVAIDPYQSGYTTVSDLQRATRPDLVNAGMAPELVDRVKDEVGDFVEVDDAE